MTDALEAGHLAPGLRDYSKTPRKEAEEGSKSLPQLRFSNEKSEVILEGDNYDACYAATLDTWLNNNDLLGTYQVESRGVQRYGGKVETA